MIVSTALSKLLPWLDELGLLLASYEAHYVVLLTPSRQEVMSALGSH